MKRFLKLVSLTLVFAFVASLCSCAAKNEQQTETTTAAQTTETTPAETPEPTPTPTPEPTPVPEPTATPTPTPTPVPVPKTFAKVFSMMASTQGKSLEQAVKITENFLGESLGEPHIYNQNHNYNVDVTIEGVHFDNFTIMIGKGKYKDQVVFISFGNSTDDKAKLQGYYNKYSKLLKKKYKKPVDTVKNKYQKITTYKISKKYATNCGWYYDGTTRSFWINYYLKAANK